MASKIIVPELGESVIEATVGRWLKKEGDRVKAGEPLVSLETDKVDLEIGSQQSGILSRIERQEGEDVKIGDVLATVEDLPEEIGEPHRDGGKSREVVQPQVEREVPVKPVETQPEPTKPEKPKQVSESSPAEEKITPLARRLAEEQGIDLSRIEGSGPGRRITKEDVLRFQEAIPREPSRQSIPHPVVEPAPEERITSTGEIQKGKREVRQRMTRRRRTIAQRLMEAQQTTAMLTTFNDADMSAVMDLRKRRRDEFKERFGTGLGIVSFFVKASIGALKQFPEVNSEIQGDQLVLKYYYDIGVAIGAEEGLVVPVLRDADKMSFNEIERTIQDFVQKSQGGDLSVEDLRGGTFTITNGGVFGSLLSTPILNPPQTSILGLHRIEDRAVVRDNQVVVRPMMYIALTYDHRIIDGRVAVQFLARIKELIEDPERLLLET